MQPSSNSSKPRFSASLGKKSTVKSPEQPLVRIIHLDCGAGGDCTVLYTDSQFIAIDGGKGGTGTRLTALLKTLIGSGKMPLAFIVSHFDLDHYYGLFDAIGNICIDPGTPDKTPLKTLTVLTPADVSIINRTAKVYPDDLESGTNPFIRCRTLKTTAQYYSVDVKYSAPEHLSFENGIQLELQSSVSQYAPSYCERRNSTSLQWILKDGEKRTSTTYYTGGDSEEGPLPATIVKLDHHGSTVDGTNSEVAALTDASYWLIMGAGRGFKHPGEGLLKSAKENNPWVLMTHHHFEDEFLKYERLGIGRMAPKWGDIGVSLYGNEKILVNINAEQHVLTASKASSSLTEIESNQLDGALNKLLTDTRKIKDCPDEKRGKRGAEEKIQKKFKCVVPGCEEEAKKVVVSVESVDLIVCGTHKSEQLRLQKQQLREKRGLNVKRGRDRDSGDEDRDISEDDELGKSSPLKTRVLKKIKNDKNSKSTVQNVKKI